MDVRDPFHPWKSLVVRKEGGRKWIVAVFADLDISDMEGALMIAGMQHL